MCCVFSVVNSRDDLFQNPAMSRAKADDAWCARVLRLGAELALARGARAIKKKGQAVPSWSPLCLDASYAAPEPIETDDHNGTSHLAPNGSG